VRDVALETLRALASVLLIVGLVILGYLWWYGG